MIQTLRLSFAFSAALLCLSLSAEQSQASSQPPNVILIMADDLGAECLECYGGQSYRTPNLDKLAQEGIRFENMYASPVCTPSRVEIMTGRYSPRTRSTSLGDFFGEGDNILPSRMLTEASKKKPYWRENKPHSLREPIFGNLMKSVGYSTCIVGKWQLSYLFRYSELPKDAGFDEHALWSWFWIDDYTYADSPGNDDSNVRGHTTSRYWNPHVIENGTDKLLKNEFGPDYLNQYALDFISRNAKKNQPFFLYYPMVLPHTPFIETPLTLGKTKNDKEKFAGMVEYMDRLVGNVVAQVKKENIENDTLIIFLADNGTDHRITSRYKGLSIPGGKSPHKLSEAGNRVPLIASWPGVITPNQVTEQMADLSDIYMTLADLADTEPPSNIIFDGYSLLPAFKNEGSTGREWTYRQIGKKTCYVRTQQYRVWRTGEFEDMTDRYHARKIESPTLSQLATRDAMMEELQTTYRGEESINTR